jgi:hypothetical protein
MLTASIALVLAKLATFERTIIRPETNTPMVAYDNPPFAIAAADMPLFVNFVGPLSQNLGTSSDDGAREFLETRTYMLNLYHSPAAAGVDGEKYGLLTPYFDLVYSLFAAYPHLSNMGNIVSSLILTDSGMVTLPYANQPYYGIRFSLQVVSRARRPLASDE